MREISVFDVIGPNMIGPSSSHTAGALRIALLAHRLMEAPVKRVRFILYGSFARTYHGHGTDRALLGGMMGFSPEDRRIHSSFQLADEAGIRYSFECNTTQTVVVQQLDTPGVIAHITQCLYEEGINIAYLNVYRENRYEHAYSVIEADGDLPDSLVEKLKNIPAVLQVNLIKL